MTLLNFNLFFLLKLFFQIAIEYYESIKSERYLIFKNKTQSLLMKPNVVKAMNSAHVQDMKVEQE